MSVRTRKPLVPGTQSPIREVPKSIERPEYVWKKTANEGHEPWLQTPETIEKMRLASKLAAQALDAAGIKRSRPASPPMSSTASCTSTS